MFSGGMNGGHDDVLKASPTSPEQTSKLIEEIKSRGRAAFGQGNYPLAEVLYSKGIELDPHAILYSNRALARMNLGKLDESIDDSKSSISLDPNYVKGHWRLAQALIAKRNYSEALQAFEKAVKIEPENKAIKKELEKCKAKAEQVRSKRSLSDELGMEG
ncbi:hypothetical protein TL16_g07981 [Triparma laevis f. inornata]|uniref:Tetratricopeptide repeat protein n=1 Tax=Triparma laevis f. inornata TaxID=1714386 RepID=A0A9W7EHB5_9STRA|nr:hypothetical protein TL16_g07981 [Triparma laevis f. inornata]